MTTKTMFIISIEGNIGAGKTTILNNLQKKLENDKRVLFLREPVDIWETIVDKNTGKNILQSFYTDPNKYAFTFQVMAYATRLSHIRSAMKLNPECKIIVCERSLEADKNIFAKMLYNDGKMDDLQYQIYNKFYNEYSTEFGLDGIVYIDTSAEKCYERIEKRNRSGESNIELQYLKTCKEYHDKWLCENNNLDILHINTTNDVKYELNNDKDEGTQWLCEIENYIYSKM